MIFPRYILATENRKNFSYICYRPPNFGGKQREPQMPKNWFQAYISVSQMEKSDVCIQVFMCSQASDFSADFSWRHMQTGSKNPPKPEVVITKRREDISTWSQRLQHSFRACPIHFHLRRPRPTMENTVRCKPEVVKVSETGSTINLANGNRYRRNLSGYTYVFGSNFFTGV